MMSGKVKVVELEVNPTPSPEYHIQLTLLLAFNFSSDQRVLHHDHHTRTGVCITIPQDLPAGKNIRDVCEEKLCDALDAALQSLYLPHLCAAEIDALADYVSCFASCAVIVEPRCAYTMVLSAEFLDQLVFLVPVHVLELALTDRPAYRALADSYAVDPETVTDTSCSICLEDFEGGAEAALYPCRHVFHGDCAKRWLSGDERRGCPICYLPVEKVYHYCKLCRGKIMR